MPTYDYACDHCEHQFELFQSITEPVKRKCPECGRLKLRRLIGPGGAIVFKGSGFYKTDYRSESYRKAAAAETTSTNGKSTPASSNGEGSSAAKTETATKSENAAKATGTSKSGRKKKD